MADNEYIKRSEVVGLIEDKLKRCETVPEAIVCASLRTAVMGLRSADVAPRAEWISVEERIPKNFESVLVLATRLEDDEYDVLVAYHDRGDWEEQHTRRYESPICGEIKYWMPLPEPLKGEQNDTN